jgi:uncharacterized protein (DUF302 family)
MHFFSKCVSMNFPDAVVATKEVLQRHGFSILAEVDMHKVLRKHLSVDLRPYAIFCACSLPLAHRAIKADDAIGSLLLCDVVIREHSDGCVEISAVDPACTIGTINHVEMISIAQELQSLVRMLMDDIGTTTRLPRAA